MGTGVNRGGRLHMYVTFKLVDDGECVYPENIKWFATEELADKYYRNTDENVQIEEVSCISDDFEIYQYLQIKYAVGKKTEIEFKTTTSIDKNKDNVNSIISFGDMVYVDVYVKNERDGYRKLPKVLDALDSLFFNLREDEDSIVHHKVGIMNIDKEEFFKMVDQ